MLALGAAVYRVRERSVPDIYETVREEGLDMAAGKSNPKAKNKRRTWFDWESLPPSRIVPGTDRYDRHIAKRRQAELIESRKKEAARKKIDSVLRSTKKAKAKSAAAKKKKIGTAVKSVQNVTPRAAKKGGTYAPGFGGPSVQGTREARAVNLKKKTIKSQVPKKHTTAPKGSTVKTFDISDAVARARKALGQGTKEAKKKATEKLGVKIQW